MLNDFFIFLFSRHASEKWDTLFTTSTHGREPSFTWGPLPCFTLGKEENQSNPSSIIFFISHFAMDLIVFLHTESLQHINSASPVHSQCGFPQRGRGQDGRSAENRHVTRSELKLKTSMQNLYLFIVITISVVVWLVCKKRLLVLMSCPAEV